MELQTIRAADVLQIAQSFRARAAEADDARYRQLMQRAAQDLEDRAAFLASSGETALREYEGAAH